jgi:hypothetical protein
MRVGQNISPNAQIAAGPNAHLRPSNTQVYEPTRAAIGFPLAAATYFRPNTRSIIAVSV